MLNIEFNETIFGTTTLNKKDWVDWYMSMFNVFKLILYIKLEINESFVSKNIKFERFRFGIAVFSEWLVMVLGYSHLQRQGQKQENTKTKLGKIRKHNANVFLQSWPM